MNPVIEFAFNIVIIILLFSVLSCKLGYYMIRRREQQYRHHLLKIQQQLDTIEALKNQLLKDN